jgi:tetratricopeptide (TPR) repeat protein
LLRQPVSTTGSVQKTAVLLLPRGRAVGDAILEDFRRDPQQAGNPLQRPRRAETQERVAPDTRVSDRCDRSHRTACRAGRKPTSERANRRRECCDIGRARRSAGAIEITGTSPQQAQSWKRTTSIYLYSQFSEEGFTKAIDYFNRAIEKDPNFALAYSELGEAYGEASVFTQPPRDAICSAPRRTER